MVDGISRNMSGIGSTLKVGEVESMKWTKCKTFCVPKRPHDGRSKAVWQWDRNSYALFVQFHNQENNIIVSGVEVLCIHGVEGEQNMHKPKTLRML